MKDLIKSLRGTGHNPIVLQEKVVILPFGGRIIGLYPDKKHNLFWTNQSLRSEKDARLFFKGEGWLNIGGDRTWISPEIDTNIVDPQHFKETYEIPKSIDPGDYEVTIHDEESVTIKADMDVLFQRSKEHIKLNLTKQVSIKDVPPVDIPKDVGFSGYILKCSLKVESEISGKVRPGIWNLIQVPGNGEIIVPIKSGAKPRAFIGKPVFSIEDNLIRCNVKTSASFKFSIRARYSTGLMFYINIKTEPASMVVRKFQVYDDTFYADVPCDEPRDTGYVQQVYVDDGTLGGFGELEYHSPAIRADRGNETHDTSEVWAFTGSKALIQDIRNAILEEYIL